MKYPQFNHFHYIDLRKSPVTKAELAVKMGLESLGLENPGIEYDGALPAEWVEGFLTHCKKNDLAINYAITVSTTFWVYYEGDPIGRPYSGCSEVQWAIEAYTKEQNL